MLHYTTSYRVNFGKRIHPLVMLGTFSADEWETFIEEWVDLKKVKYLEVERFGGAGDKGRDVAAYITDPKVPNYKWDCYQCKHYSTSLSPSQMWVEFGKIIYYTFKGDYPIPEKYYFVAPKGCGTSLTQLLQNPTELRNSILKKWDKYISSEITKDEVITLTPALKTYIDNFNFKIFDRIQPKTIIAEHELHPNHSTWFGGGLPDRQVFDESSVPESVGDDETIYVDQLRLAYNTEANPKYQSILELTDDSKYHKHFKRARISFHHAEQLRSFSRDNLPNGTYEKFQEEIYDGIINLVENDYNSGFEKVKAVESFSASVQISSNALKDVSIVKDKAGVCHQLCNNRKISWV